MNTASAMKWSNLKKNKCPKCPGELGFYDQLTRVIGCSRCDFRISEDKMREIVENRVSGDIDRRMEVKGETLGEEIQEDFL